MIHEELYIIVDGARKKLDLPSPSGITLNFVSNLFNDLSKINASYSYTFKLPRTANNVRVLELVDDVRADGKFTRIKNDAEYVYDGVSLFSNANMYISNVENDTISAVLTWNVNKGLQELSKHDMSLNELGNHLPDGEYDYVGDAASDYEKDKVVLIGDGDYREVPSDLEDTHFRHHLRPNFAKFSAYNPTQPCFKSLHNGGIVPYFDPPNLWYVYVSTPTVEDYPLYEAEGKLSPMPWVETSDVTELEKTPLYPIFGFIGDRAGKKVNFPTFAFPAPIVPVPYLVNVISRVYGLDIDLSGDLYNSLCIPLVANRESDALARLNYINLSIGSYGDHWHSNSLMLTGTIVNNYPNINPIIEISYNDDTTGSGRETLPYVVGVAHPIIDAVLGSPGIGEVFLGGMFTGAGVGSALQQLTMNFKVGVSNYSELKLRFGGKVKFYVPGGNRWYQDDVMPKLVFYGGSYKDLRDFYVIGELKAVDVRRFWENGDYLEEITFNCNPSEGFENFETSAISRCAIRLELMYGESYYDRVVRVEGSLRMYVAVTNYPMACCINLYKNLPDISCMEFIKSVCYALGGFPYMDATGKIKLQEYSRVVSHIGTGDVYDWTAKSLKALGADKEEFVYSPTEATGLTLAKKNYFLMKNDKLDEFGEEEPNNKQEDAYEHGYNCVSVDSDMLDEVQTLFTFPFYGGFLWQKDFYAVKDFTQGMLVGGRSTYVVNSQTIVDGSNEIVPLIGQDMWRIASKADEGLRAYQYPEMSMGESKPIMGVIVPFSVPQAIITEGHEIIDPDYGEEYWYSIEYTGEHTDYLSMRPWNCATDMPKVNGHDLLQEMLGNPCLVKEDMNLNVMDLATLDIEKPVYLEKYNSYFAIKNIEVGSDGISKVELIRIPPELFDPAAPTPEIVVEEPTIENGGDNGGSFEVVDPWAEP